MKTSSDSLSKDKGNGSAAPFHKIIGLPHDTAPDELARAADKRWQILIDGASSGDAQAQRELVELHVAYLIWAYAPKRSGILADADIGSVESRPIMAHERIGGRLGLRNSVLRRSEVRCP